jgi:hypothetical protein
MAPRTTLHIYDDAHEGEVSRAIRRWRCEDDLKAPEIKIRLREDLGINVSERTLYRWLEEIERDAADGSQPSEAAS